MYLLKEDFLNIFQKGTTRNEARQMILRWCKNVLNLQYNRFIGFAQTVLKRIDIILNWFDFPISNGKAEGVNNVIKSFLKRAYGYKDFEYFRSKVLLKLRRISVKLRMVFYLLPIHFEREPEKELKNARIPTRFFSELQENRYFHKTIKRRLHGNTKLSLTAYFA